MAFYEINAKGGVMGMKIEARGGRPGSELAAVRREGAPADHQDKVAVTFGCWTSVSRKSVLPVFEELNACSSTRCSTRARRSRATCSTPAPRPTSRRSRRSNT
jgi:ABC-type branched-subunit amino acid transport system substrate-binding protein